MNITFVCAGFDWFFSRACLLQISVQAKRNDGKGTDKFANICIHTVNEEYRSLDSSRSDAGDHLEVLSPKDEQRIEDNEGFFSSRPTLRWFLLVMFYVG